MGEAEESDEDKDKADAVGAVDVVVEGAPEGRPPWSAFKTARMASSQPRQAPSSAKYRWKRAEGVHRVNPKGGAGGTGGTQPSTGGLAKWSISSAWSRSIVCLIRASLILVVLAVIALPAGVIVASLFAVVIRVVAGVVLGVVAGVVMGVAAEVAEGALVLRLRS